MLNRRNAIVSAAAAIAASGAGIVPTATSAEEADLDRTIDGLVREYIAIYRHPAIGRLQLIDALVASVEGGYGFSDDISEEEYKRIEARLDRIRDRAYRRRIELYGRRRAV